jgi:hypothetical protein
MNGKLRRAPRRPKHKAASNAYVIICNTHDACSSFLDVFETGRRARNAKGAPTNEEQDLLRAMLVFATSGLDSMIKQLIRDTLPAVVERDEGARTVVTTYVERMIRRSDQTDIRLLATALLARKPRDIFIDRVIADLTSGSLQSKDELLRIAACFNIPSARLVTNDSSLSDIFTARNQIIHEMDIDFAQPRRNRRPRRKETMVRYTNDILTIASLFLGEVDGRM